MFQRNNTKQHLPAVRHPPEEKGLLAGKHEAETSCRASNREKQKKQNQDCLPRNPEIVDSFHKKLDEIMHPVIEEFGIVMQ